MSLAKQLRNVINSAEPSVARGFRASVEDLRDNAAVGALAEAIARKDIDGVLALLDIEAAAFVPLRDALLKAFKNGGDTAAARMTAMVARAPRRGTRTA